MNRAEGEALLWDLGCAPSEEPALPILGDLSCVPACFDGAKTWWGMFSNTAAGARVKFNVLTTLFGAQ